MRELSHSLWIYPAMSSSSSESFRSIPLHWHQLRAAKTYELQLIQNHSHCNFSQPFLANIATTVPVVDWTSTDPEPPATDISTLRTFCCACHSWHVAVARKTFEEKVTWGRKKTIPLLFFCFVVWWSFHFAILQCSFLCSFGPQWRWLEIWVPGWGAAAV